MQEVGAHRRSKRRQAWWESSGVGDALQGTTQKTTKLEVLRARAAALLATWDAHFLSALSPCVANERVRHQRLKKRSLRRLAARARAGPPDVPTQPAYFYVGNWKPAGSS